MDARQIIDTLGGRETVSAALGVTESSVREACRNNQFPANWYDGLDRLGQSQRVKVPRDLFNWRKPTAA